MEQKNARINGSLKVSANVIVNIAQAAAAEINGAVITPANKLAVFLHSPAANQLINPVKVRLGSESAVIDISMMTDMNHKACEVARAVQENVKSAVQNMTGITVSKVNVKIIAVKNGN